MARTRTDSLECATPLRLRIPASLAVVILGASATVAMSVASCESSPIPPPPVDAGQVNKRSDAGPDTLFAEDEDPLSDATSSDVPILVDAPPDTPTG